MSLFNINAQGLPQLQVEILPSLKAQLGCHLLPAQIALLEEKTHQRLSALYDAAFKAFLESDRKAHPDADFLGQLNGEVAAGELATTSLKPEHDGPLTAREFAEEIGVDDTQILDLLGAYSHALMRVSKLAWLDEIAEDREFDEDF